MAHGQATGYSKNIVCKLISPFIITLIDVFEKRLKSLEYWNTRKLIIFTYPRNQRKTKVSNVILSSVYLVINTFQLAFNCLKLRIETLEQGVKYVQS